MASDPYITLGIAKGATEAEIKKAYRKLAKELHPDKNKDNPKASEKFSDATKAYDLLSDKDKRARFDRGEIDAEGNPAMPFGFGQGGGFRGGGASGGFGGQQGGGPGGFDFQGEGVDLGDIFDGLFGGGGARSRGPFGRAAPPPPPRKGANIGYKLAVTFVDAATQKPQRITLVDGKTIDLKLPAGLEAGTQMKLGGKGEAGPGGNGDAMVTLDVKPHRFFKRDGDDILLELPISLKEAVEGAKVKTPTVDGPVMVSVPPMSSSGKILRLKGKGFSKKGGARGDQLVTLMIELPAEDSALQDFAAGWTGGDGASLRKDLNG